MDVLRNRSFSFLIVFSSKSFGPCPRHNVDRLPLIPDNIQFSRQRTSRQGPSRTAHRLCFAAKLSNDTSPNQLPQPLLLTTTTSRQLHHKRSKKNMPTPIFTGFSDSPQEIQLQIWALAARTERDTQPVFEPRWKTHRAHCMISAFMLGAADLTCFHGTSHNLDVLRDVCVHRKSLMETCALSRQAALEMWRKDVQNTEEAGGRLYGCLWMDEDRKARILEFLNGLLQ